jgi:hypothetical protein
VRGGWCRVAQRSEQLQWMISARALAEAVRNQGEATWARWSGREQTGQLRKKEEGGGPSARACGVVAEAVGAARVGANGGETGNHAGDPGT